MTEAEFSGVLDLVYEAAVEPETWGAVMERFTDLIGGNSAWLSQLNVEDGSGGGVITRIDPRMPAVYSEHFALRNPLANVEDPRAYMSGWAPRILTDEDWMPKEALLRSEYYNDFLRPQDIHSTLMIRLAARGFDISVMNINRPRRQGQFQRRELDVAQRLHPHLIRAFNLSQKVSFGRGLNAGLAEILDRSPHGLFLLGEDGAVRHLNRSAEALVAAEDALTVAGGRLVAVAPGATARLRALIGAAATRDGQRRSGGSMALTAPRRRLPLSVTVTPVRSERFSVLMNGPAVMVCVADLEARVDLPEQKLRDLFGLSRAEARVALILFDGADPRAAAAKLKLSFHTVRGHLVRIFEKTQTTGQADLARLMMRAVGAG